MGKELTREEYEMLLRQKEQRVANWERYGIVPKKTAIHDWLREAAV